MNSNVLVSLIVAVYKDLEALKLIVESLGKQTYSNFELIVAEDNNSQEIRDYIKSIRNIRIKHTQQDDKGIRKSRSINNAILASSGEYLIFIDGDCIPYSTFIDSHVKLSEKGHILSGRRINLGKFYSSSIRRGLISSRLVEKSFPLNIPLMLLDKASHIEQGVYIQPAGWLYTKLISKRKRNTNLLGCNFSCFRSDILAINGFDESYEGTAVGDDTDLEWRFTANGLNIKSCKNACNIFHLHHTSEHRMVDSSKEIKLMNERKINNIFYCENGLSRH